MGLARVHPNVVYSQATPNASSRRGLKPTIIVVHSTEGRNIPHSAADLRGVTDYLCRTSTQASAHVVTDSDGNSARICKDSLKAWHCAGFNPISLGIEQVGLASGFWGPSEYRETARWIARWNKMYGIPIRKGAVSGATVTRTGILRHSNLGTFGGGHSDPGAQYDLGDVLDLARYFRRRL